MRQKGTLLRGYPPVSSRKDWIGQKGTRKIPGMIGYARVSREEQNPQYQLDALQAAGCARIFEDRMSGADFSRAGLNQALAALEPGGVLVVWKLDRLGRSMLETVKIVLDLDRSAEIVAVNPLAMVTIIRDEMPGAEYEVVLRHAHFEAGR